MSHFTQEMKVYIEPFTRQTEGPEVVIGIPKLSTFLALPVNAVQVLDDLAGGKTVGQAEELYRLRHGEVPDLISLLTALEERGFVRSSEAPTGTEAPLTNFHLERFPSILAEILFGRLALTLYTFQIASAMALVAVDPGVIPGVETFVFKEQMSLTNLAIVMVMLVTLGIHELAHVVAARACGVSSRFGVGHRLWDLVAEADLTGLWAVPRKRRIVPLLAGMIADAVLASLLLWLLFARKQGWLSWSWPSIQFVEAIFLILLLRLLWQFFFHVRTDLYYVVTNLFGCKNLMGDTETYLRNLMSRFFSSSRHIDQSHIPVHERRIIRSYAAVWVFGRTLGVSTLLFIRLPVLLQYLALSFPLIFFQRPATVYQYVDALFMILFILIMNGLGAFFWLRSLYQRGVHRV